MAFQIQYFCTNTLLITTGVTRILIDPHFTRLTKIALLKKIAPDTNLIRRELAKLPGDKIDAILLTHTHYDHALDAFETARLKQAKLIGSSSVTMLAHGADLPDEQVSTVDPCQDIYLGDMRVTFLLSSHLSFPQPFADWLHIDGSIETALQPPVWFWQYRAGSVYSLLVQARDRSLYIMGSAGFRLDEQEDVQAGHAFLSIGGLGFKREAYIQAWFEHNILQTGARRVYLSHWDDFTRQNRPRPHRLPGLRRTLRIIRKIAKAYPDIEIDLLMPGGVINV